MGEDWTIIPGPLFPTSLFSQMHVMFFFRTSVKAHAIEMQMDISQQQLGVEFTREMPDASPRPPFCARPENRNAHGHFTRTILRGNVRKIGRKLAGRG